MGVRIGIGVGELGRVGDGGRMGEGVEDWWGGGRREGEGRGESVLREV